VTVEEIVPQMSLVQRLGLGGASADGVVGGGSNEFANKIQSGRPLVFSDVSADADGMTPVSEAVADFVLKNVGGGRPPVEYSTRTVRDKWVRCN